MVLDKQINNTMKRLATIGLITFMIITVGAYRVLARPGALERDEAIETRIREIMSGMTLEEKIGQMCQLTIDVLQDKSAPETEGFQLSEEALERIIGQYKVGSILNVPLGVAQTPSEWRRIIGRIQEKSLEAIGIPCLYGVDQIHGTTYTLGGTLFPQGVNMAATFNRSLVREASRISAYETRTGGIPWTFAPVCDLGRDARWPRMWENYGEDCYLNAEMGRESVLGFQGSAPNHIDSLHIAACMKHFMGYGVPVSGKDRTPSSILPETLREKHFAPYLEMIRHGALSIMVNSAMNGGVPFHANHELLTGWLKEELDWDGMIVTDWADINNLWKRDHVARDAKDAIRLAINAGIDMAMEPYDPSFCTLLHELVSEGLVPMSRIDDAVSRILRLKLRLGLMPMTGSGRPQWIAPTEESLCGIRDDYPLFGSEEHAAVALEAALEGIVLLKNEDELLPLPRSARLLVSGPNANSMRCLNGGWSYSWQGDKADLLASDHNTILEALEKEFGPENVVYEPGVCYKRGGKWWQEEEPQIEKAVKAAEEVDYIVICVGENSYCETTGNLDDLSLSSNQLALVEALSKTGKPLLLVLNEGRPRILSSIEPLAGAVVDVMLPGNYGGDALAMLLSGRANFSGRLPFTYPRHQASLVTYDYKPSEHIGKHMEGAYDYDALVQVQWPFGYGLSYTDFAYSNLKADKTSFTDSDTLTFTIEVKNTGNVAGKESVLLFSSDLVASLTPDVRRLRGFEKVELQPGEAITVSISIPASDLAFVSSDGHWLLEEGDFMMQIADQTLTISCRETHRWESPNK